MFSRFFVRRGENRIVSLNPAFRGFFVVNKSSSASHVEACTA
jgi:hypothetical protein